MPRAHETIEADVNVMQPLQPHVMRVAVLATVGARGPAWVVDMATGAIVAASAPARARMPRRLADEAAGLTDVFTLFGETSATKILAELSPAQVGQKKPLTLSLTGLIRMASAELVCRKLQLPQSPQQAGLADYAWIELTDIDAATVENGKVTFGPRAGSTTADGTAVGQREAVSGAAPEQPTPQEPSPLVKLPRPEVGAADRATLDDIAQRLDGRNPVGPNKDDTSEATRTGAPQKPGGQTDLNVLAHELRTPIGAITTLAQVLRPSCAPAAVHYLDDIEMCANHALDVLQNTVGNGRAPLIPPVTGELSEAAATTALELRATDLANLASEVCQAMTPAARSKSIRIACYAEIGMPDVLTCPRAVRQILFNLVTNAVKYTDTGGDVTVTVEIDRSDCPTLRVRDTGRGMTVDDLERAKSGRPSGDRPSHYGLRVVRTLTAQLGGKLTIDSKPGSGTLVSIALPRSSEASPAT